MLTYIVPVCVVDCVSVVYMFVYWFIWFVSLQIDNLLESFCKDMKITVDQAVEGINKMSEVPDLREVFHVSVNQL